MQNNSEKNSAAPLGAAFFMQFCSFFADTVSEWRSFGAILPDTVSDVCGEFCDIAAQKGDVGVRDDFERAALEVHLAE